MKPNMRGENMEIYRNISGNSGVVAFEIGANYVRVQFRHGTPYLYTYHTAGIANVDEMKRLARLGQGLNTFINQTPAVKNGWVR
jgi:hypothetical protein